MTTNKLTNVERGRLAYNAKRGDREAREALAKDRKDDSATNLADLESELGER